LRFPHHYELRIENLEWIMKSTDHQFEIPWLEPVEGSMLN